MSQHSSQQCYHILLFIISLAKCFLSEDSQTDLIPFLLNLYLMHRSTSLLHQFKAKVMNGI